MIYQPITNPEEKCGAMAQDPLINAIAEKMGMYQGEVIVMVMVAEGILEPHHIIPIMESVARRLPKPLK